MQGYFFQSLRWIPCRCCGLPRGNARQRGFSLQVLQTTNSEQQGHILLHHVFLLCMMTPWVQKKHSINLLSVRGEIFLFSSAALPWFSSFLVNTRTAHCRAQFIPYLWSLWKRFFNNGVVMSHLHTCTNVTIAFLSQDTHTDTHKDWLTDFEFCEHIT